MSTVPEGYYDDKGRIVRAVSEEHCSYFKRHFCMSRDCDLCFARINPPQEVVDAKWIGSEDPSPDQIKDVYGGTRYPMVTVRFHGGPRDGVTQQNLVHCGVYRFVELGRPTEVYVEERRE